MSAVEVAQILALLTGAGGLAFWGGELRQMVRNHEDRLDSHSDRLTKLEDR